MRLMVVVTILAGALALTGCEEYERGLRELGLLEPEQSVAPASRSHAPALPQVVDAAKPAEVFERVRSQLRVPPDRRFLRALGRLEAFVGAKPLGAAEARYEDGAYRLSVAGSELGSVPELSGCDALWEVLAARAQSVWRASGLRAKGKLAADDARSVEPLLGAKVVQRAADDAIAKGVYDVATVRRAARTWATVAVSMVDRLGVGDEVHVQALAAVAMAEAISNVPMPRERALLAYAMEYGAGAEQLAAALDRDDPVRQLVHDDIAALGADPDDTLRGMLAAQSLLRTGTSTQRARFLESRGDFARSYPELALLGVERWRAPHAWLMLVQVGLELHEVSGRLEAVQKGASTALDQLLKGELDLKRVAESLGAPPDGVLALLEGYLDDVRKLPGGPFHASDALAAYYAAQAVSAVDTLMTFRLDRLGSPEAADEGRTLLGSGRGTLGKSLARYYADITRAERRDRNVDALVQDVRELDALGVGALDRLLDPIFEQGAFSAATEQALAALLPRCDGRVACRRLLAGAANSLNDWAGAERMRVAAYAEAPRWASGVALRQLSLSRDHAAYVKALQEPSALARVRARYLFEHSDWLDPGTIKAVAQPLLAQSEDRYVVHDAYAVWLIDHGEHAEAVSVLDAYLAKPEGESPVRIVGAKARRAKALHLGGDADAARAALAPLLESMHGGVLWRAALVESSHGQHDAAIALAQNMLRRYPTPSSVELAVEVFWLAGKNDAAAALLHEWARRLTVSDWNWKIAAAFERVFAKRPPEEGEAAFKALTSKPLDPLGIRTLVSGAADVISPELAFRAYQHIPARGYERYLDVSRLHGYMLKWKGAAAAHEYLARALEGMPRDPLSQFAYSVRGYDLIWDELPDPAEGFEHQAFVWLMRVAAYLQSPKDRAERRARIDAYFAKERAHAHDAMAKHLLGSADEDAVWAATPADKRPLATWVFGLKAELDADVDRAATWYRVTMQSARQSSGELQWATNSLERWRSAHKSLALIADDIRRERAAAGL